MENNKRTKGELKINPVETYYNDLGIMSPLIKDGEVKKGFSFKNVCRIDFDLPFEESKANAEFICEAWNNYDKLKEDNEKLLYLIKWAKKVIEANVPKLPGYGAVEILPQIEEVIKKAESK